jgi:purine nucleosidase
MARTFLIDTDTASDDAVALIMALRAEDVHVAGITVVAGNVTLEQATRNALYTVELCGASTPVFKGARQPLVRPYHSATWFHGEDGFGDRGYPEPKLKAETADATDAIVSIIRDNPGLELVTLGPLTNVALAIQKNPSIAKQVSRCVIMGGAPCCEGNVTPAAEYNIWVDPDAARIVLQAGFPVELIGWQLCRGEAIIDDGEIAGLLALNTPAAKFAVECNSTASESIRTQTGEVGICLPDPVAMGIAIDPTLATEASVHLVDIEIESNLTRGMTVVDRLNVAGDDRNRRVWAQAIQSGSKAKVIWRMDVPRWKRQLFEALGKGAN